MRSSNQRNVLTGLLCLVFIGFLIPPLNAGDFPVSLTNRQKQKLKKYRKDVKSKEGTNFLQTENFTCKTPTDREWTAKLGLYMELFYDKFQSLVSYEENVNRTMTVVIFNSEDKYKEKYTDGSRGKYDYDWNRKGKWTKFHLYTYLNSRQERNDFNNFYHPILKHEGAHLFLQKIVGKTYLPPWFDEGMAMLFQFWNLEENVQKNLANHWNYSDFRKELRKVVNQNNLEELTIKELMNIEDYDEFNPDNMGPKARLNYAASESLIHFISVSQEGRKLMDKYIKKLKKQQKAPRFWTDDQIKRNEPRWHKHIKQIVQ